MAMVRTSTGFLPCRAASAIRVAVAAVSVATVTGGVLPMPGAASTTGAWATTTTVCTGTTTASLACSLCVVCRTIVAEFRAVAVFPIGENQVLLPIPALYILPAVQALCHRRHLLPAVQVRHLQHLAVQAPLLRLLAAQAAQAAIAIKFRHSLALGLPALL